MAPLKTNLGSNITRITIKKTSGKLNSIINGESPINSVRAEHPEAAHLAMLRNGNQPNQFVIENQSFDIDDDYNSN